MHRLSIEDILLVTKQYERGKPFTVNRKPRLLFCSRQNEGLLSNDPVDYRAWMTTRICISHGTAFLTRMRDSRRGP